MFQSKLIFHSFCFVLFNLLKYLTPPMVSYQYRDLYEIFHAKEYSSFHWYQRAIILLFSKRACALDVYPQEKGKKNHISLDFSLLVFSL